MLRLLKIAQIQDSYLIISQKTKRKNFFVLFKRFSFAVCFIFDYYFSGFFLREVWPENDCFGYANMAPEEEFMAIRDIFMANIQSEYKEYYYWKV